MKPILIAVLCAGGMFAQSVVVTGPMVDLSQNSHVKPMPFYATPLTLPATGCQQYEMAYVISTNSIYVDTTNGGCTWGPLAGGSGGGLNDPGMNGVIKRTALNVTAPAVYSDIVALFSGCSGTQYLGADGACHTASGGGGGGGTITQITVNAPLSASPANPIVSTGTIQCLLCVTPSGTINSGSLIFAAGPTTISTGALTGDGTTSGNVFTLANVNSTPGACGDATHVGVNTINSKGLVTNCTPVAITGGGGGTTGNSYVTNSGASPQTILAVTHGQGVNADVFCFSGPLVTGATTGHLVNCDYTKNAAGDMTINWGASTVASIQVFSSGPGPAGPPGTGLGDPGSNGPIKRTALNVTAPAAAPDIIGLFLGCSGTMYLGADGICHNTSGVTIQTNGVNNLSQTALNIRSGTNVTVTNTAGGDVLISSSGGGGGVGVPYAVNSTTSPQTILATTHNQGINPAAQCWSGALSFGATTGNLVQCAISKNASGDLTVSWSGSAVGSIEVMSAGAGGGGGGGGTPAPYVTSSSTSPQTITAASHSQGINPWVICFSGGLSTGATTGTYTPCAFSKNAAGDVVVSWSGTVGSIEVMAAGPGSGGGGGLADPGSNGIMKRTALNVTAPAAASDVIALFTGCSGIQYPGADGACHTAATVSSVGLTAMSWLSVGGSPVTGAGVLALTPATSQIPHQVIGTCGTATTFGPCNLVAADISVAGTLSNNTTGTAFNVTSTVAVANGGTGATTLSGVLKGNATSPLSAAAASDIASLFSGCSGTQYLGADGACHNPSGGGSVSSVGMLLPTSVFSIIGSPVTSTGTLTGSFINQAANTFFAGPCSGSATTPAFRGLCAGDLTALGTLTNNTSGNAATATALAAAGTLCPSGNYARGVDVSGNALGCTAATGGGGTVTSVATVGPITGGPFTTSGTLGCPTCVTITTPTSVGAIMMNISGNAVAANSNAIISTGGDISTLGVVQAAKGFVLPQGADPGNFAGNSIQLLAPASVPTAYRLIFPAADAPGFLKSNGAGTPGQLSFVNVIPVANGGTGATTLTGLVKGSGTSPLSAASASDVVALFSGCSGTQYLGADGACHTASGGTSNVGGGVNITASPYNATCNGTNQHTAVLAALNAGVTNFWFPKNCVWVLPTSTWSYNPGTGSVSVNANTTPGGMIWTGEDWNSSSIKVASPASNLLNIGAFSQVNNMNMVGAGCDAGTLTPGTDPCPNAAYSNSSNLPMAFVSDGWQSVTMNVGAQHDLAGIQVRQMGTGDGIYAESSYLGSAFRSGTFNVPNSVVNTGTGGSCGTGVDVCYVSGVNFANLNGRVGQPVYVGSTRYIIASWISNTHFTITTSAGNNTGASAALSDGGAQGFFAHRKNNGIGFYMVDDSSGILCDGTCAAKGQGFVYFTPVRQSGEMLYFAQRTSNFSGTALYLDMAQNGFGGSFGGWFAYWTNVGALKFGVDYTGKAYVQTLNIAAAPTSAGTGGLYLCVDSSGETYKKSSCP